MAVAFATVPYYREHWSLTRLGQPSCVDHVVARLYDLVPLRGGPTRTPPTRGLRRAVNLTGLLSRTARMVVACTDDHGHKARSVWLVPPDEVFATAARLAAGRRTVAVVVDGAAAEPLGGGGAPPPAAVVLRRYPARAGLPADAPAGSLLHDPLLGYLGALAPCGRWHVVTGEVCAAPTEQGLAYTLPRQRSPRLVDITLGDRAPTRLDRCHVHQTPVVEP